MSIRVLVVDDAPFIRDMLRKQLRDHIPNLEIKEATDGAKALSVMKQWWPDIVLSDWEMPNMTGEELLSEVRNLPNGAKLPFIMVTNRGDRDHVVKAVQAGVSDYITKPFTTEELLRKVSKQLKAKGQLMAQPKMAAGQNIAFASLDILTGGRTETHTAKPVTPAPTASSALFLPHAAPSLTEVKTRPKGLAHLSFADEDKLDCVIREMSLQLMSCTLERGSHIPRLFDSLEVEIDTGDGEPVTSLKGYIHSTQASENHPDARAIKLVIRFVDNDPQKFKTLSKFIAQI
jgi:DNA-binding response OmpR family regulator